VKNKQITFILKLSSKNTLAKAGFSIADEKSNILLVCQNKS